jgi:hypothetical protein
MWFDLGSDASLVVGVVTVRVVTGMIELDLAVHPKSRNWRYSIGEHDLQVVSPKQFAKIAREEANKGMSHIYAVVCQSQPLDNLPGYTITRIAEKQMGTRGRATYRKTQNILDALKHPDLPLSLLVLQKQNLDLCCGLVFQTLSIANTQKSLDISSIPGNVTGQSCLLQPSLLSLPRSQRKRMRRSRDTHIVRVPQTSPPGD